MTRFQIELVRALADNNQVITKTAEQVHKNPSTVRWHCEKIQEQTGLNPLDFKDLRAILDELDAQKTIVQCRVCGKAFEALDDSYKYCSDECQAVADAETRQRACELQRERRERDQELRRQWKLEQYKKPSTIRLAGLPSLSLAEVNQKAREAGMSYGKYVAMARGI